MRDGRAAERVAESAEEAEDVGGALHFAGGFGEGLAFLAREQFGKFGFAGFEDLRSFAQDATARGRRGGGPTGEGGFRRGDGCCGVILAGERILGDELAGVSGVEVLEGLAGFRGDPFARDEVGVVAHDNVGQK